MIPHVRPNATCNYVLEVHKGAFTDYMALIINFKGAFTYYVCGQSWYY